MDDSVLAERQARSHRAFYERLVERCECPGGSLLVGVTPQAPDRSLPNAVLYDDPADVVGHYDAIADVYRAAGVRAWTVWVRPGDEELGSHLAAAGHSHDGRPQLMAAPLEELELGGDLEPEPVTEWSVVGEINDRAYGIESGFAPVVARYRTDSASGWLARVDDEPAACVGILDCGGDAYVNMVATLPAARGRGLCSGLMRHALGQAFESGCTTTSLEGSPMGEPLYARLGYRSLGRFGLWERRLRADSP